MLGYIDEPSYVNGNYLVKWGRHSMIKRAFRINEELKSDFPDSIDLKISNRCKWGCPFCHENSTPSGKVITDAAIQELLSQLPNAPIEIAIGGGNILEDTESTWKVVNALSQRGYLLRGTINYRDLYDIKNLYDVYGSSYLKKKIRDKEDTSETKTIPEDILRKLNILDSLGGIGISIGDHLPDDFYSTLTECTWYFATRTEKVIHVIAGILPVTDLEKLLDPDNFYSSCPVLILGYKQWGRAKNTELPESLSEFEKKLKEILSKQYKTGDKITVAFDNLALEQLHMKEFISQKQWDAMYMGDEGTHSMYVDAVERKFAINSRSPQRVSWDDTTLIDYFKTLNDDKNNN